MHVMILHDIVVNLRNCELAAGWFSFIFLVWKTPWGHIKVTQGDRPVTSRRPSPSLAATLLSTGERRWYSGSRTTLGRSSEIRLTLCDFNEAMVWILKRSRSQPCNYYFILLNTSNWTWGRKTSTSKCIWFLRLYYLQVVLARIMVLNCPTDNQ